MSRELLQQALDALENHRDPLSEAAGNALRAALAAPQPEPVAEVIDREHQPWEHGKHTSWLVNPSDLPAGTKLYAAAPPAAPAPVDWGTPHDVSGAPWGAPAPAVCDGGTCGLGGYCTNCPRLSAAPAVPDLKHKPTVQRLMDLARKFRSAPGDLYDGAYKELQSACYEALSAAPAVREPLTDAQIDKIFDDAHENMPKGELFRTFVTRAIERAHGIGGGGNG